MRVLVVGGVRSAEESIARRAAALGHEVEFHRGDVGGRRAQELDARIRRCDVAIVVTRTNSHGAMHIAKRAAARLGRRAIIVRTCGASRFGALLEAA